VSTSDELKERDILKLILIMRFACATLDVGHSIFGYVKHQFQGHEFMEGAELVSTVSEILNQIPTDTLVDVFEDWMGRLQRCMNISGEYVEQQLFFLIYGLPQITHFGDATVRVEHPVSVLSHPR
jgi:hypothetical protein